MIQRLHASSSYSNLISLEEKPNGWNTATASKGAPMTFSHQFQRQMGDQLSCSITNDDAAASTANYYRTTSPFSVTDEDDDSSEESDNESMETESLDDSMSSCVSLTEPLKAGNGFCASRPGGARVQFDSTVAVHLIPSHKDYPFEMRQRIWASLEEIRVNAVRSSMQLYMEDDDDEEEEEESEHDESCVGEQCRRFIPLCQLRRTR